MKVGFCCFVLFPLFPFGENGDSASFSFFGSAFNYLFPEGKPFPHRLAAPLLRFFFLFFPPFSG